MKKVAQLKTLENQNLPKSQEQLSGFNKEKKRVLQDITYHLQQIGMKVMGVCVTEEDDLSFLKMYSNLSAVQATSFNGNLQVVKDDVDEIVSANKFTKNLSISLFKAGLPN